MSTELNEKAETAIDLGNETDFSLGALLVRPASREVVLDGRADMIEPRVMQTLIALARRRGEVVSRDQLVETCWSGRVVGEDAITRCIAKVRRLASPTTFELETIPRVGYRLIVASGPPATATDASAAPVDPVVPKRAAPRRRKVIFIAAIVTSIFVAAGAYWTWLAVQALGASTLSEAGSILYGGTKPNFAVLPFDAVGTDADTVYLADAIPTAINNQLIALGFKVVTPAVAMQYRGKRKEQAAVELGPRYIIDGSVRVDGETLRVTTRVDSGAEQVSVWSRDFAVNVRDATDLPNKITTTLAGMGIFSATARTQIASSPSVIAGAMRVSDRSLAGDDMGAYLLAKQLLREAPNAIYAQAVYVIFTSEVLDLLPSDERAGALADARRVAKQADMISVIGTPVGLQALMPPVDWSARERVLRKALDADLPIAGLRYTFAGVLVSAGRISEAKALARAAVALDPLVPNNSWVYASVLDIAGDREQADNLLARAARLWPNRATFEHVRFSHALGNDDLQTASSMLADPVVKATLEPPAEQQPYAAIVRALQTRDPVDIAAVEQQCADPARLSRRLGGPCLIGLVKLNRLDTFFKVAPLYFPDQRGSSSKERDARWLENPMAWRMLRVLFRADMAAVRADERFIPIAERMGLLDYWKTSGKWPDFCATEPKSICARMRVR